MDCICDKFVMVEDGEVFEMSQAAKGDPGPGVAPGGTTGQLLAKASDEDYDTEWIDQPEMDAEHVSYDSTETYSDGTVGKELTTINSALSSLSAVTEIIDTASGAIASFPDGSGLPMRSLLAQIEPQQEGSGDPSPENVRPISGWTGLSGQRCGVNIGEFTHGKGIDTGGHIHDIANRSATVTPIKIDSTRQYKYVNSMGSGVAGIYAVWNGDTLVRRVAGMSSGTVMDTSGGDSLYVCGYSGDADVLPETCGVFFADQYEEFVPYTGEAISVTWQTEAGTVYGGTVDVVTGVLTATHLYKQYTGHSSENWKYSGWTKVLTYAFYSEFNLWAAENNNGIKYCNEFPITDYNGLRDNDVPAITFTGGGAYYPSLRIPKELVSSDDTAGICAYLAEHPLEIVYKIATPQTYQLTPQQISTLLGNNTVFVDCGAVSVTYQASIKGYIDKVLAS